MYELKFYCPVCGEQKSISIENDQQDFIKNIWCHKHRINVNYDCVEANLKVSADLYLNEVKTK